MKKKKLFTSKGMGQIPLAKNKVCEILIDGLSSGGEGVGRYEGFTVFVPGALPGEKAQICIEEVKSTYATAKLLALLKESPSRVTSPCPYYETCGGCQMAHMNYEDQLRIKRQIVTDAITRIGKMPHLFVSDTTPSPQKWRYRNKMQFPVRKSADRLLIGCYRKGSHQIVDADDCLLEQEGNNELLRAMRSTLQKIPLPIYDEDKGTGFLRHIMGRVNQKGDIMAVLVTAGENFPQGKRIVKELTMSLPQKLISVWQNIQTYRNNVILGKTTNRLWGSMYLVENIHDLSFRISPKSFFQVNTKAAEILYQKILDCAGLTGRETVVDAYCGTGSITLFLARSAKRVIGIEIVESAIHDAFENAKANNINNARFIRGDAAKLLPELYRDGLKADVCVLDPPRAGSSPEALFAIARMDPRRIVYVSCNPATLARDLSILSTYGYEAKRVEPVDMFPQTASVESVSLLEKTNV